VRLVEVLDGPGRGLDAGDSEVVRQCLNATARAIEPYDPGLIDGTSLREEWESMITLYRSVRQAADRMQRTHRFSEVSEVVAGAYYRLRSIQGGLSMRYGWVGPVVDSPPRSPLGTTIGLFDAPKIRAQGTHLESGSYDADLGWFADWMREICEDLRVRLADYYAFYGVAETDDAREALRGLLNLGLDGIPILYALGPKEERDPQLLVDRLIAWTGGAADLVERVRMIQGVGHEARVCLLSLIAHAGAYVDRLGSDGCDRARSLLETATMWPLPSGPAGPVDLAVEQAAFDALLSEVGPGRPLARHEPSLRRALARACEIEQWLRDRATEPGQPPSRRRISLRWYVWELSELLGALVGGRPLGT
jgi:hypothetical protein